MIPEPAPSRTAASASSREGRVAVRTRASRSRPRPSVPKGWAAEGPRSTTEGSGRSAAAPQTIGPATASATSDASMNAVAQAIGERRKPEGRHMGHISRMAERGSSTASSTSTRRPASSTVVPSTSTIAWTTGKSCATADWAMAEPMPGQAKTFSTSTVPAIRAGSRPPHDRECGCGRVGRGVPEVAPCGRQPFAPGGAQVVLVQHLQRFHPDDAEQDGCGGEREREDGQDEGSDARRSGHREQLEADGQ